MAATGTYDESAILEGIKELDEAAFAQLHRLFFRQLCFYAAQITDNKAVAEDIAAESFIKLLNNRYEFASFGKLRSFLFTVAHNAALDYQKTHKRRQQVNEQLGYEANIVAGPDEFAMIQAEVLNAVFLEIEQLPPQCREIIRLSFVEGLSLPEIASQMQLAYKTVQNQKARGLNLLRTALVKKSINPLVLALCLPALFQK